MMRSKARLWWGVLAIVALAINLRPGATSLGPVLAEVQAGLGMGGSLAGLLTSAPGFAFAVFGAFAVVIGLRLGLAGGLLVAALGAALGLLGRTFVDSVPLFFVLTALAFAGMAIGNVLVPAFIKGAMASLLAAFGVPAGFVMPVVVARVRDPRWVVVLLGALLVGGYLGVWLAPTTTPWLWAALLGVSGFAFPMAMALITARTRDAHTTTQLSGFTQSVGYLFSGIGPLLVGILFEVTGGWDVPLWFLLGSAAVFVAAGVVAAGPGYVDDELAARV